MKNIANISDINNLLTILKKVGLSVKRKNDNISISGFCNEMPESTENDEHYRINNCPYYSYKEGSLKCELCPNGYFVKTNQEVLFNILTYSKFLLFSLL